MDSELRLFEELPEVDEAVFRCLLPSEAKLPKELEGKSEEERWAVSRRMGVLLDREEAAFDVIPHPKAPAGLRIWCGPTIDADDVVALGPWLDWA